MSQAQKCKQLAQSGVSIRGISATLGISRNTIRSYLRGDRIPGNYSMRSARPQPAREEVRDRIRGLLEAERAAETPRKQRLTAARIHRLLSSEGSAVSERTVRIVVREVRDQLRDALEHAYLPLEYRPGEDGQVDFFEGVADDAQLGRIKVNMLVVRACYSGRAFIYVAPNQTREALLEGLMQSFDFFGGVFRNLWFDNLTPAVKKVLQGRSREMQRAFECFVAHYGFEPQFCSPGKGNEKGGVEGAGRYMRHEILSPIPAIEGRQDLQRIAGEWMERELSRTIRGRTRTIGELWREAVPELMPMPVSRFEVSTLRSAKVSGRSWIQVGTNFYSVPVAWVGLSVDLKIDAERLVITGPKVERVEHRRLYGSGQMALAISHYLPLLARKHRGLDRAIPVRRFLDREGAAWTVLLERLRKREGEVRGSKAFVEALQLCETYETARVTEAVRRTVQHEEVSLGLIRFNLWNAAEQAKEGPTAIDYPGPTVAQASVKDYQALLGGTEVARV